MPAEPIAIASDHAGFELKESLKSDLEARGFAPLDLGTASKDSVDYPDFADRLAGAIRDGRAKRGVLVCGTGIGIAMPPTGTGMCVRRSATMRQARGLRGCTTTRM